MNKAIKSYLECLLAVSTATLLCACGGGSDSLPGAAAPSVTFAAAPLATGTTIFQLDNAVLADAPGQDQVALPAFHAAPVLLNEPDDLDVHDNAASARTRPHRHAIPAQSAGLSSRRLTAQGIREHHAGRHGTADKASMPTMTQNASAAPMAAGSVIATYTPAQIRAAYGLPALPVAGSIITPAQAAQMGAGQTIYIIDAMHDPNVAAQLAAFNAKFGLPTCTTQAISTTTRLPLAPASTTTPGCVLSVAYATASGAMTGTAPAYDSGWATEIALDVQWAHATAPLARIILIESSDASLNGLLGAVNLANAMGPGIVSMSFGGAEGNWTGSVESAFSGANMTYLAAAGDSGAGVQWPAVSPHVVAVGGTSLTYSGSGVRSEAAWAGTGGGVSAYTPTPAYQVNAIPGLGSVAHRSVTDVSFNADPATGQYLAVMPAGSTAVSWISVGGTSLSTPQWAGVIAIANAQRAMAGKALLGAPHAVLYTQIATVPGTYASTFGDVIKGADGSCSLCAARTGYDQPTGLGTPNVIPMLNALSGISPAPVVTPATITGTVGTPLSFTVSVVAANPMTYALAGAPSGLVINSTGAVTWPLPVAGTYSVTVTATDTKTGQSGQGVYTLSIAAPTAPVVSPATISGTAGAALSFPVKVTVTAANPLTYTLAGAPSGMVIGTTGSVTWTTPVAGTYTVTAVVKDTKTGLTGQGVYTVKIVAAPVPVPLGPVITGTAMTGIAGKPMTGSISYSDSGASSISISISGIPMGMTFSMSGMTLTATWANPVTGSYSLKVSAIDSAGRSAQVLIPVTVTAH